MERDLYVSEDIIRQLLRDHGYRRRQMLKYLDMDRHPDRDAQFVNIARLKEQYLNSGDPIVSIDTKKKELLGTFYRDGKVYTRQALLAYDHDFPSYAAGVVIPHGIYDLRRNFGYISVGTSKDTSEFACDSIAWWWTEFGRGLYRGARSIGLLCDGGGRQRRPPYLFKEDLQKLSGKASLNPFVVLAVPR